MEKLEIIRITPIRDFNKLSGKHKPYSYLYPFGGLVVSVLASGSRVRGFEPRRSRWILLCKKSSARLPSEGKLNNLSHVPTLGHVKEPFSRSKLRAASGILSVPSFANRRLSHRLVRWRPWR
jgi:hypothetical protein